MPTKSTRSKTSSVNDAIKSLRVEVLRWSQQRFATELGISINGVQNYERDRTPPLLTLARIMDLAFKEEERAAPNDGDAIPIFISDITYAIRDAFYTKFEKERPTSITTFALSSGPEAERQGGVVFEALKSYEEYTFGRAFADLMKAFRDPRTEAAARKFLRELTRGQREITGGKWK